MTDYWGDMARIRVVTVKSWTDPDSKEGKDIMNVTEIQEVVEGLRVDATLPEAEATGSASAKISHSEYWGQGTWDKIPYSVEVFTSVKLKCDQSGDKIVAATNLAQELATLKTREHMEFALAAHTTNIRENLYSELFD